MQENFHSTALVDKQEKWRHVAANHPSTIVDSFVKIYAKQTLIMSIY